MRRLGFAGARRVGEERIEVETAVAALAAHNHVLEARQQRAIDRLELAEQRAADDQHARAAVAERVLIVPGAPHGVERHRHDAGLDGAEEAVGKGRRIQQHQRAALLGLDPEAPQGVAEPVDALGDLRVGDALIAALDRDLAAPSLGEMAIDKVAWRH